MENIKIVVADTDEEYLAPLEYKLAEEWNDKGDIEVITSLKYFNEYFSQPRDIFILIINEYLYSEKIRKQNCGHIFILREDEDFQDERQERGNCTSLYKYSSVKEIYSRISGTIRLESTGQATEHTRIYMTYATRGGSGKTLLSLGLSQALKALGNKVLYVCGEDFQDFSVYLENCQGFCSGRFAYSLATQSPGIRQELLPEVDTQVFDYIRPMEKAPATCQIKGGDYGAFLDVLKNSRLYDVIVFEASTGFSPEKLKLFSMADKVVVFFTPERASLCQLDVFLKSIRRDDDKLMLVCNRMKARQGLGKEDALEGNLLEGDVSKGDVLDGQYPVSEYIPEQRGPFGLEEIRESGLLKKLAYILG